MPTILYLSIPFIGFGYLIALDYAPLVALYLSIPFIGFVSLTRPCRAVGGVDLSIPFIGFSAGASGSTPLCASIFTFQFHLLDSPPPPPHNIL